MNNSNPATTASAAALSASRLETTGWVNLRSIIGLLMVLGAVLAGTLGLQRAQHLVPVYVAARDLPSGVSLSKGDLSLVRVRLPAAELGQYLRPDQGDPVLGKLLTAPLRRHMLVPAEGLVLPGGAADTVEIAIKLDHGDMPWGLRPGDHVQILAAETDGLHAAGARVVAESAEVVRILEDPAGLAGAGRESGVQVRLPSGRTASVAAAVAGARVFVVKASPLASAPVPPDAVPDSDSRVGATGPRVPGGSP